MVDISITEKNDIIILAFNGDLIFKETDNAIDLFNAQVAKTPRAIGIDCKNLKTLDSSGLGAMIRFAKDAGRGGVELVLYNVSEHTSTLFDMSKLKDFFEVTTQDDFKKRFLS